MSKKISYILPTNRPLTNSFEVLNIIFNQLPKHDMELIVAGPSGALDDASLKMCEVNGFKFKFVLDEVCQGACQPTNMAYKVSDGDWVATMSDDIGYPQNFLDVLDFMDSDHIKQKTFKIINLMWDGGPGLWTYGHDAVKDGESFWHPNEHRILEPRCYPFCVIPMPLIHRSTVETHFQGYIYHPSFKHHHADSWNGFFACHHETYEPYKWRCPTVNYLVLRNAAINLRHDFEDAHTLRRLTTAFMDGARGYADAK